MDNLSKLNKIQVVESQSFGPILTVVYIGTYSYRYISTCGHGFRVYKYVRFIISVECESQPHGSLVQFNDRCGACVCTDELAYCNW